MKRFQEDYFNYKVATISSTYIPTSKSEFTNPFIVDLAFNILVALLGGTATYSDRPPAERLELEGRISVVKNIWNAWHRRSFISHTQIRTVA